MSLGTQRAIPYALACALRYMDLGEGGEQALGSTVRVLFWVKLIHSSGSIRQLRLSLADPLLSGALFGFLGWARPTGTRLLAGLRRVLHAGVSARQWWHQQSCYLPASIQNTILTMSFRFSRVQPGAAWCLMGNTETGMTFPAPKDFRI